MHSTDAVSVQETPLGNGNAVVNGIHGVDRPDHVSNRLLDSIEAPKPAVNGAHANGHGEAEAAIRASDKPTDVDVLIVGAGPAGLMAAATLARYGKVGGQPITVRIVDKRASKIFTGQADGLNPRSLEILQALDIGPQLLQEVEQLGEICFWNPGANGKLERSGRLPDTVPGISQFIQSTIHQGRIERLFLDKIAQWSTPASSKSGSPAQSTISVERAVCPDLLRLPPVTASPLSSDPSSRITIRLRHLTASEAKPAQFHPHAADALFRSNIFTEDDAQDAAPVGLPDQEVLEEVRARYVIGADGARSWVRKALGYNLVGDSADFFWGVVDGIPMTDFPDIRMRCAVHSASSGSLMIIPREKDLVRLYIQIPQPSTGTRPNRADVTPEKLMYHARAIMAPYQIDIPNAEWFTCYEIGQRLGDHWTWNDRIFLAGDAVHTHSPKAGQGMNISMADTFNLTWKLAHVIQGRADPAILQTYIPERSQVAAELIEFDHKFSRLFSGRPQKDASDETGICLTEFKSALEKGNLFSSGTSVDYQPSVIVCKLDGPLSKPGTTCSLATNLPVGPRLKSHQVVCLSNARPYHIGDLVPADGRWRILVFAGDVRRTACRARLTSLATFLDLDPASPVRKYTGVDEEVDTAIEVLTVVSCPRTEVELDGFPDILRPLDPRGFRHHYRIFADDATYHHGHGQAYQNYGIDPVIGCVVVVRPDGYVSLVTDIADHQGIARFFNGFMLVQ